MALAAVILAAGHSSRMGAPKALLVREGDARETALARAVRAARAAGCSPVVVVLGGQAERVREATRGTLGEAVLVENPNPESGRTGSLKRGLAACAGADGALVWPIDHPSVQAGTVAALAATFFAEKPAVLVPTCLGRRGHPIVLRASVAREVESLADDAPLRDVVLRDPGRVRELAVEDEGVLANLDTPEAAARAGWARPE